MWWKVQERKQKQKHVKHEINMNGSWCSPIIVSWYLLHCVIFVCFFFLFFFSFRSTCIVSITVWAPIYRVMLVHYFYVCRRRSQWLVPSRCRRWHWQSKGLTQKNARRWTTYTILIVPKKNIYLWMKIVTRIF